MRFWSGTLSYNMGLPELRWYEGEAKAAVANANANADADGPFLFGCACCGVLWVCYAERSCVWVIGNG